MKRQVWLEFRSPGKDLAKLMQVTDGRGVVIVSKEFEPAYVMMTADKALELLIAASPCLERLPIDKALMAYEKQRAGGRERIAYLRLNRVGLSGFPRRPLPSFDEVMGAYNIALEAHKSAPADIRHRLDEHVRRWPTFVSGELTRLFESYLVSRTQKDWDEFGSYMNKLVEHSVIRRDIGRAAVPVVRCYGAWPPGDELEED